MSFSSLRTALRTAPRLSALSTPILRQSARTYSAAAPAAAKGPNYLLLGVLGAGALGGGALFALSGETDLTKVKDAAMPKEVDYQAYDLALFRPTRSK